MTIRSLQSVSGVSFGASRDALGAFGDPLRESINSLGESVVDFGPIIFRFAEGRMVEASFALPSVIDLDGQQVEGSGLLAFLEQHDRDFRKVVGFAVAPNFGLAVDLDHDDYWTTAFFAGRWDNFK
jgi:hypothetical protein